jgi:hypothetical protein
MKDLIEIAKEAGGSHRPTYELVSFTVTELAKFAELLGKTNAEPVATADCIAFLYRDRNGTLKLAQESPPPDKAFPVFTTKISFLDVARVVLDDNVDLIIKHGGVTLWKELITNINATYRSASLPAEQDAELITKLTLALQLAKDMFIANGLDLPNTMEVINEALAIANRKDGV